LRDLETGRRTVAEIQAAWQEEPDNLRGFCEENQVFLRPALTEEGHRLSYRELIQESKRILGLLPWATQEKMGMTNSI
jgi:hypothetical protein